VVVGQEKRRERVGRRKKSKITTMAKKHRSCKGRRRGEESTRAGGKGKSKRPEGRKDGGGEAKTWKARKKGGGNERRTQPLLKKKKGSPISLRKRE